MSHSALIDLSSVRVLCVDDDPMIRAVIRSALQRRGCREVVQAVGGMDALDLCAARQFDLIICDYAMTPLNGLEFLRALANSGLASGWPVIMLSAEANPATIQEAEVLGVSAWVGKPVSVLTLIDRISAVLRLHGQLSGSGQDGELLAMSDRCHARLIATLGAADELCQSLKFRSREAPHLAHGLRPILDTINENAQTLGYGLVTLLANRALDLVLAMTRNPSAAARTHAETAGALGTLVTAMKRIAHNRMEGDGAEAGLKLLERVDGLVDPVRASLN
jgi:two-component system, chemotaxis family, chemotaxis protein CheY